jgi:O-antigen ligase
MEKIFNLKKTYQYLLILLAFLMPLTVSGSNIVIVTICIIWIFSGNYIEKFNQIISSKLIIATIVFYLVHILGMLWTENLIWGFHMLHKMWYFLIFFPILFNIVQLKYIKYYTSAFLIAIAFTEIVSYLIWFEIIPPVRHASVYNPTPFMSHISYNPILAFAIYFVYHDILFNNKLSGIRAFLYIFFAATMTFNMFITGGRAGQVMYFAMISILLMQLLNTQKIKALISILVILPVIFFTAYSSSEIFNDRVDKVIFNTINYEKNSNTSVGKRITYAINSWDIILENPLIGVGTGDFPGVYTKTNKQNCEKFASSVWYDSAMCQVSKKASYTSHPHNMYLLVLVQFGLIGLISLMVIFYYQIKLSFNSPSRFLRDFGFILPVLFLIAMLSDSYLLGHYTSLFFVFFSSFLYKDFEKN